jgi:hypothetical protein
MDAAVKRVAVTILAAGGIGVSVAQRVSNVALTQAKLRLGVWEARLDPDFDAWRDEQLARVSDGSIWADIANQPPADELIAKLHSARTT